MTLALLIVTAKKYHLVYEKGGVLPLILLGILRYPGTGNSYLVYTSTMLKRVSARCESTATRKLQRACLSSSSFKLIRAAANAVPGNIQ